jgi:hypothetical protein
LAGALKPLSNDDKTAQKPSDHLDDTQNGKSEQSLAKEIHNSDEIIQSDENNQAQTSKEGTGQMLVEKDDMLTTSKQTDSREENGTTEFSEKSGTDKGAELSKEPDESLMTREKGTTEFSEKSGTDKGAELSNESDEASITTQEGGTTKKSKKKAQTKKSGDEAPQKRSKKRPFNREIFTYQMPSDRVLGIFVVADGPRGTIRACSLSENWSYRYLEMALNAW